MGQRPAPGPCLGETAKKGQDNQISNVYGTAQMTFCLVVQYPVDVVTGKMSVPSLVSG